MNEDHMQIVEINGVKMEVDTRNAKVVHENIKVGSPVKLLVKSSYGSPDVHTGVVIGFMAFDELPTITIAYVKNSYGDADLEFAHINSNSADKFSIVPCYDDELPLNRNEMITKFDRQVGKKEAEIREIENKKAYFLKHFDQFFAGNSLEIDA